MQFKHPELLWALFLLLIPIIIHLFQLRRFKKTPFTNVKLLKSIVSKSRKSSTLKKWLLLFSRLGLLTGLILAFAQPFNANERAVKEKENNFYLDNSFSMQAKTANATLFQNTVQEFIKHVPKNQKFNLFTNDNTFLDVEINDIKNTLLELQPSSKQLSLKEVIFKANTLYKNDNTTDKNTIIISDFQQRLGKFPKDSSSNVSLHYINPLKEKINNIAIDSIYIKTSQNNNMDLVALISANYTLETTPISLYNGNKLIAKTAANFDKSNKAVVQFSLANYNLIVLNELTAIPTGLTNALHSFTKDGGSLVIIPAAKIDLSSYNQLVSRYSQMLPKHFPCRIMLLFYWVWIMCIFFPHHYKILILKILR